MAQNSALVPEAAVDPQPRGSVGRPWGRDSSTPRAEEKSGGGLHTRPAPIVLAAWMPEDVAREESCAADVPLRPADVSTMCWDFVSSYEEKWWVSIEVQRRGFCAACWSLARTALLSVVTLIVHDRHHALKHSRRQIKMLIVDQLRPHPRRFKGPQDAESPRFGGIGGTNGPRMPQSILQTASRASAKSTSAEMIGLAPGNGATAVDAPKGSANLTISRGSLFCLVSVHVTVCPSVSKMSGPLVQSFVGRFALVRRHAKFFLSRVQC
jgi:hypothetical protein